MIGKKRGETNIAYMLVVTVVIVALGLAVFGGIQGIVGTSSLANALQYLADQGYTAYADSGGNWVVTGDINQDPGHTNNFNGNRLGNISTLNPGDATNKSYVDMADNLSAYDAYVIASNAPQSLKDAGNASHARGMNVWVCDGVNDDVEIQEAIDAIALTYGGTVILSGDLFWINQTVSISNRCRLIGQGHASTMLILKPNANTDILNVSGPECEVSHLKLDGNHHLNNAGKGLVFSASSSLLMIDVNVVNTYEENVYANGFSCCYFYDCTFADAGLSGNVVGLSLNAGAGPFFNKVIIKNSQGIGLLLSGVSDAVMEGVLVHECNLNVSGYGVVLSHASGHFVSCSVSGISSVGNGGFWIGTSSAFIQLTGCAGRNLSGAGLAGLYIEDAGGMSNITIIGSMFVENAGYGVWIGGKLNKFVFVDNIIGNNSAGNYVTSADLAITQGVVKDNAGYIFAGESRGSSGSLLAGPTNNISFAWHNPEDQDILIEKVVLEITTPGGTATSVLQVGIADDAAGTNLGSEFFTGADLDSGSVRDSYLAGDTGTQTKFVFCQDSVAATDGWIVGKIITENASSLGGKYYIYYTGR
jgi:hypothetical protein